MIDMDNKTALSNETVPESGRWLGCESMPRLFRQVLDDPAPLALGDLKQASLGKGHGVKLGGKEQNSA